MVQQRPYFRAAHESVIWLPGGTPWSLKPTNLPPQSPSQGWPWDRVPVFEEEVPPSASVLDLREFADWSSLNCESGDVAEELSGIKLASVGGETQMDTISSPTSAVGGDGP